MNGGIFRVEWIDADTIELTPMDKMFPPTDEAPPLSPILKYFKYEHLPPSLQAVSRPFCDLAFQLERELPICPEKSTALRKLLEAKDCAVRCLVP